MKRAEIKIGQKEFSDSIKNINQAILELKKFENDENFDKNMKICQKVFQKSQKLKKEYDQKQKLKFRNLFKHEKR